MPKHNTPETILMIHGFRGTHHGLDLIAKDLKKYEVIVPDLPGFADGESINSYDLDGYVDWLNTYISKLKTKPYLLGHSFGSIVCAAYASRYPDTIKSLVLVNPIGAPALEGPRAILSKLALFYYKIGEKLPDGLARAWLASPLVVQIMSSTMTKTSDKKLRKYIHAQHHEHFSKFHSPKSVSEGFETSIRNNVLDHASSIKVPALLIVGEKDDITSLAQQENLLEQFPNAKMIKIKNVGHLTHYETPDQVAQAIDYFIRSE